jgi:hypothetical protein
VVSGDTVVDATAGNGHDTVFLARLAAPGGLVHGFDVQSRAIERTRERLIEHGLESMSRLYIEGHEKAATILQRAGVRSIRAAMFNLGYLPGSDKSHVTAADSTCRALAGLMPMIEPGGLITVVLYRAHPGGREEADAVVEWARNAAPDEFVIGHFRPLNQGPARPELLAIRRRPARGDRKETQRLTDGAHAAG